MSKIAIIQVGQQGERIAELLARQLKAERINRADVARQWNDFSAFVFIGALGICVRSIAPCVNDKHSDPAVVCIDSMGLHTIAVLSGHAGGANRLTETIADCLGAMPVVTTQSDLAGIWSLDTLDARFGWTARCEDMNACVVAFVNREPTALLMETRDRGTEYMERQLPQHVTPIKDMREFDTARYRLLIIVGPYIHTVPDGTLLLQYVPKVGTVGFGLASHPDNYRDIYKEMMDAFAERGLYDCALHFCTIDAKKDEEFVELLRKEGRTVLLYTAAQLATVSVPNPSSTVERLMGTASVCEAAAILGSRHGKLVVQKVKGANWTAALAIDHQYLRSTKGHIEIVGAGPGDPELVSLRGSRMLQRADLILYAGSLVPKELTDCHKAGAVVRSSADMTLEEQCALMKEHYDKGHFIVRLHTGDPCIFGAIQEQMAFFDSEGMDYHITPGISSFLAAAAELRSQFTIPEQTQTIILTRGEGRTPMPEREKLHLLARSQSTMCIFLSAAIVDDVQRELLMEYPEDTPVAVCYHLTWPDQTIYHGMLSQLATIVHDNQLTLTTMIVVGQAIGKREGQSALYSRHFTHLYRKGDDAER